MENDNVFNRTQLSNPTRSLIQVLRSLRLEHHKVVRVADEDPLE
jgi:hypothetical protein